MTFREEYQKKPVKPIRWHIVLYSIVLSEAVTYIVSTALGIFIPLLYIMGALVPLLVAPGMMYYSYSLRAKLIEQLIQSEERVRRSLREKEILLQEVHHRVKNNMAIIMGFLGLQSSFTFDPEAKRILKESQDRIRSMALVHEKLHLKGEAVKVDLESYISTLLAGLLSSYNNPSRRVTRSIDIEDVDLDIKTTISCGLIINELVTNSLKYAFEGIKSPMVSIELRAEDEEVFLIVSDNGVGIPEDMDIHGGKTLGLQIVEGLVGQVGGTMELDTSEGSTFQIKFSRSQKEESSLNRTA